MLGICQTLFCSKTARKWCAAAALISIGLPCLAGDGMFMHRAADGSVTFSDAPMVNGKIVRTSYLNLVRAPSGSNPCRGLTHAQLDAKGHSFNSEFIKAAAQYSVDPALLKAVARAESCFDPTAESHAGAKGLMQLMPSTAKRDILQILIWRWLPTMQAPGTWTNIMACHLLLRHVSTSIRSKHFTNNTLDISVSHRC